MLFQTVERERTYMDFNVVLYSFILKIEWFWFGQTCFSETAKLFLNNFIVSYNFNNIL